MTPLFTSWVCDYCDNAPPQPSGGDALPVKDVYKPDGYPTGFNALDRITGTGGYPMGAISELFGCDQTLTKCWHALVNHQLDLDRYTTEELVEQVRQVLTVTHVVAVRVYGGTGQLYVDLSDALYEHVTRSGTSAVVLFNSTVQSNGLSSVAPKAVKIAADLRIRLMANVATVVKSRWGHTNLCCALP